MINEGNEPENFFWVGLGERVPYDTVRFIFILNEYWFFISRLLITCVTCVYLNVRMITDILLSQKNTLIFVKYERWNLNEIVEFLCALIRTIYSMTIACYWTQEILSFFGKAQLPVLLKWNSLLKVLKFVRASLIRLWEMKFSFCSALHSTFTNAWTWSATKITFNGEKFRTTRISQMFSCLVKT